MNPRLVAMAGPVEGRVFEIEDLPFRIGRHSSNHLQVRQITVSRYQCVLEEGEAGGIVLRDLDSRHGTFVNSLPVKRRELAHGDYLRISETVFLYLEEPDGEREAALPVALSGGDVVAQSTVQLRPGEALFRSPEAMAAKPSPSPEAARHLGTLLEVANSLHALCDVESLARRLMECLLEVLPASRAAVLLVDPRGELSEGYRHDRDAGKFSTPSTSGTSSTSNNTGNTGNAAVHVSRTVARRVLDEGMAMLLNDVLLTEAFEVSKSLEAERIQSLLCAPLPGTERSLGLLYVDTRDEKVRFAEEDLHFLAAVAGIFALALENVRNVEWLVGENRRLQTAELEHDMVGESRSMLEIYRLIARIAPTNSTVLISGESGTGKELAAKALHTNSPRCDAPFLAINCANLSETLLESELFGYVKGAFTGASTSHRGKLEVADGGTVFLDEIGELSLGLQAKLLRVIEEREIERLGSTARTPVDIRLIAATHRDLEAEIGRGTFRQDLYFRLNVITLAMPPLRDRRDDIPLLATHFAARFARRFKRQVVGIAPEARKALETYDWPGNVRELANAMERAVVLGQSELIRPEDLPESMLESGGTKSAPTTYHEKVNETKRRVIVEAVERAGGNVSRAARSLGLHPNYLHRLISNLGLRDDPRDDPSA